MVRLLKSIVNAGRRVSGKIRRTYFSWRVRARAGSCGEDLTVNFRSQATRTTHLGDHVNFNGLQISGGGRVTIGNYFHSGKDCFFVTSFHDYDNGSHIPYGAESIHRDIEIGDFVWLGDRVTILGGVKIGEGAVVQAGSVVVNDIPDMAVAGGHPAKVFKYRNKERFLRLKAEGQFF